MSAEPQIATPDDKPGGQSVEMPRPTVAPIVLSLGLALLGAGVIFGLSFLVAGAVVFIAGLGLWISSLLPGQGHMHEALAAPDERAQAIVGTPGLVEQLLPGRPGYRIQLPQMVHPTSAGVRGGILGGLVIPIPALIYGVVSGHGIWYPVNLLAGMVVPGVGTYSLPELQQFHPLLLFVGIAIHAAVSITFGLLYGVLLPTLPAILKPFSWGGLLMPLLWTAVSFTLMGFVNPTLQRGVDWPSFILSQFIFGMVAALVVTRARHLRPLVKGVLGGLVGGLLMPGPAVIWGVLTSRGVWYPGNLLAGMVDRSIGHQSLDELKQFHPEWLVTALALHATLSLVFGIVYGLSLPRLPVIPGPMCWGSLLMPTLWTSVSYGLMGVVNPVLQQRVDWPWFIVSQFIFGFVASIAVVRSEKISIPPAGAGPAPLPAGQEA